MINFIVLFLCLLALKGYATESIQLSFVVRKDDSLSEILDWLGLCPVWGKDSLVKKTAEINKEAIKESGHLIFPNKRILLPASRLLPHDDYSISHDGQVILLTKKPRFKCSRKQEIKPYRQIASDLENPSNFGDMATPKKLLHLPKIEPSSVMNKVQIEEDESHGHLRVERDFYYSALDLKDKHTGDSAKLLSRVNNTSKIYWDQVWDKEHKTFLFYKSGNQDYEPYETKFNGKKIGLQGFGIGFDKKLNQDFGLTILAQIEEKPFLKAITISTIIMERAMIPSLELRPKFKLVSRRKLSLNAEGTFGYLLPGETSNYKIESGYRMGAGLSVVQKIKDFEIKGSGFYNIESQHTKIMEKEVKELGISLGVSWSFGK